MNKVIKEIIKTLERQNEIYNHNIDIPFVISPLVRHLEADNYKEFLKDIENNDCIFTYIKTNCDEYANGKIEISLYEKNTCYNTILNARYMLTFAFDERDWGYCECTPSDNDYRSDKNCCGHGCDWSAPAFELEKIISVGNDSWDGDEHDYWDFEDEYYGVNDEDRENREMKAKIDKINSEIKYHEEQLSNAKKKLSDLKNDVLKTQ